jgi:class 3 adenylate cyclase
MNTPWRVELLGGLRAQHGERLVTHFRTQNTGTLLAYLAYYPQRAHLRDELIDLLWPDADPDAARTSLRQALFLLRQQLEPPGVPPGAVLLATRASVRLNPEAVTTDVAEFDTALQAAERAGSPAERTECLAQAVERYGGPLLPGHYDEWVLREREWLVERYFAALGELLAHLERASEFPRALEYARRGVSADPLREEGHRDLMRLLAAAGQPGAALRQYQEVERLLREELEATPAGATRALAREIERLALLRQAPAVGPPLPGPRAAPSGEPPLTPADGENRLVTVLFTDMSRSVETTRDLPPEDGAALVNRLLQAMVDAILKYEGRIDRFQGDGVLAAFGVPRAHEDDAERAIRAAMEIREAARHLGLEVTGGINTGEVYVGPVGTERHREVTVMGPAVSLAARLQGQAQPGQILIGEATYRQTRQAFEFEPLSLTIKGLAQPVAAHAVRDALPHPEKARGVEGLCGGLIGREEELGKLKKALGEVLQGRGQMVSLIGEAGVGKSRLITELKALSACLLPTPLWLEGRCLELGMTASYWPFLDLFRDCFASRPEENEPARADRLVSALTELGGDLSQAQLDEMAPLLGNLLSVRFGNEWDERLKHASPEQIKHQTFIAIREFFLALSRRQPLVLVLEDLHWADSLSLDLISLLMETLAVTSILLLCAYRPEREHKCWHLGTIASRKCAERYTELPLRDLSPPQSRRLVETLLCAEHLPAPVNEAILKKSGGNPFFVEEVVRSLIDAGMLHRAGDRWRAREEITSVAVPESIQSVILSRVDRLEEESKQVLQSAAVIGRLFPRRLLADTTTAPELERILWGLEDRGLIYEDRVVPEVEYSFRHALTQETVYQSILRRHRAVIHQSVAEAIEALDPEALETRYEQLAYHYERSHAVERAVAYLLKAGEKARRAYLNEEAIGYFKRALERLEGQAPESGVVLGDTEGNWRLAALKGLGQTYQGMGKVADAEEYFRQAIRLGKEIGLPPREQARLYHDLGEVLFWQSRYDERICVGEEGLALLGEDTESVEAALMNATAALGYLYRGDPKKWREFALQNARFLQRLPYSEELRPPYCYIVWVYKDEKNPDEAMKWLQLLEEQTQHHHDLRGLAAAHIVAGQLFSSTGHLERAIARYQQALELCSKTGDVMHESWCLVEMAKTFVSLGNVQDAEECAHRALRILGGAGTKDDIAQAYMVIGTRWFCHGSWEKAAGAF